MVEATAFDVDKVTRDTRIKNTPPDEPALAVARLTKQIDEKAEGKNAQLGACPLPGILAIVSSHIGSSLVLDALAAEDALISQSFWVRGKDRMFTDLSSSLFLRLEDGGKIATKNTSISAVLFLSVTHDKTYVCGALNPAATHRFRTEPLWMIPFVYLKDWPVEEATPRLEWTLGSQRRYVAEHRSIKLS
jgi:hypothetical protein